MVFLGFLMSQNGLLVAEFVMCFLTVFAQQVGLAEFAGCGPFRLTHTK